MAKKTKKEPSAHIKGYAELRRQLTRLSEARKRWEKAWAVDGGPSPSGDRAHEKWRAELETTRILALKVLDIDNPSC